MALPVYCASEPTAPLRLSRSTNLFKLFRRIVKRHAVGGKLIYTPGNEPMCCRGYVSADMTHPSGEGQRQIAENWGAVMKKYFDEHRINGQNKAKTAEKRLEKSV